MQIIKLDATESTNTYLKDLVRHHNVKDFTVVMARYQTKGRGQRDGNWIVEPGKNLTFSVLKSFQNLRLNQQFILNMIISLAIHDTLKVFQVPRIKIKWPNDILSGSYKVCGILIENILTGKRMKFAVIGIGLNVNQISFPNNPKASSVAKQTGREHELEKILGILLNKVQEGIERIENEDFERIYDDYQSKLFRKGVASTFEHRNGSIFNGIIQGVTFDGRLEVLLENDSLREFELKEIKLLY